MEFSLEEKRTGKLDEETLASVLKEFRIQGYIVLKDVFPKTKIKELNDLLTRDYARYFKDKEHEGALKVGQGRFAITIDMKEGFNAPDIYCHSLILELLSHLLEPEFLISDLTCVVSLPGSTEMQAHRDGSIFNNSPIRHMLPPFAVGLLIPLISFNQNNGTTRIWPRTHSAKTSVEQIERRTDFIDAEIDSGSCIVMDYRLYHAGNPNNSQTVRPLLYCNYSSPWYLDYNSFKKQARFYLSDEELLKIPREYRKMFVRRNMDLSSTYRLLNREKSEPENKTD